MREGIFIREECLSKRGISYRMDFTRNGIFINNGRLPEKGVSGRILIERRIVFKELLY